MKEFRWLFVIVLAVALSLAFLSAPISLGVSAEWSNGNYRFAGGTHPVALGLALTISGLYLLLMFAPPASFGAPLPSVFRRFGAFWLDFILAMILVTPVVGVLPALTEWKRTGSFQWNFERTTHAPGDGWLLTAGLILVSVGIVLYYAYPLIRCRPSPGACIVGYQIVPDDGITITPKMALLRTLLGIVAASAAYLAPFIARDQQRGKFWLDKVFGTRAMILR